MATLTTSYQLLAQKKLGAVYGSNSAYIRLYAKYNSQSTSGNSTSVSIQARLYNESTWYASSGTYYRITGSESIDSGNVSCLTSASNMWAKGEVILGTQTKNVIHNSDGTRTIHAEVQFVSSPWGWNVTASASGVTLPIIPRASTVSCSSPYIGDVATITIGKKSSSFTSTVTYKIGSLTGTIATKTSSTVLSLDTATLKEQIYALIPNAKNISGTITCTTYSGNTQIGSSATATFNLYAREDECKPEVTGEIIDVNEATINLTGNSLIIVKNASKPKITVIATPKYSSTIKSYSINLNDGQTASSQEYTFDSINSNKVTVSATDSRGYNNSFDIDLTDRVIDYIKLHFNNIDLTRPEGTSNEVILNANGVWFNGNFNDETTNTLAANFQYKLSDSTEWIDGGTLTPTINGNIFTFTDTSLGKVFDYNNEYQFKIVLSDSLITVGSENKEKITVSKGQETVAIGEDAVWVYGDLLLNDTNILDEISDTYSTEEQVIGTFMGKPLYRKVGSITFTSLYTGSGSYTRGSYISGYIKYGTVTKIFAKTPLTTALYNSYNKATTSNVYVENEDGYQYKGYVMGFTNNETYLNQTLYIVVEYTKTTD